MAKTIEKRIRSKYFKKIEDGSKTYELRLADWECNEGDTLVLIETNDITNLPTGRKLSKQVGWVGKTKDTNFWTKEQVEKYGYQVISLLPIPCTTPTVELHEK